MKLMKKIIMTMVVLGICVAVASGSDSETQRPRGRHQGPPPEAYTACECKEAGDTAQFESPRGDIVTGTCKKDGDRLVLRPDNPPRNGAGDRDSADMDNE